MLRAQLLRHGLSIHLRRNLALIDLWRRLKPVALRHLIELRLLWRGLVLELNGLRLLLLNERLLLLLLDRLRLIPCIVLLRSIGSGRLHLPRRRVLGLGRSLILSKCISILLHELLGALLLEIGLLLLLLLML